MADITLEKSLPHNLDAERSILGSILLENRALNQAQELLRGEDFYRDGHRRIFRAMEVLRDGSGVIDLITLKNELTRSGELEAAGGPAYVASLVDGVPKSSNVEYYARIVKEKAILRGLIETGNRIVNLCFEGESPVQDVLDEAQRQIFALAEGNLSTGFVPVKEVAAPTLAYIDRLHEHQELITGLATGFERLDEMTSGLQNSDLIVLAARPSMGKAQPLDAKVKTLGGWKRMGDMKLGDELASVDGSRSIVSGIFPQGVQRIFRVKFSDGRSAEVTGDHLWSVSYRLWPERRILTTKQVMEKLTYKRYRHRLWIDMPSGDWGHDAPLPLDPWILGALLGDGTLTSPKFSTTDQELLDRFVERCGGFELRAAGGCDYRVVQAGGCNRPGVYGVTKNQVKESLKSLGLWNLKSEQKFIPDIYLTARKPDRLLLLQGLMDTDGWVEKFGSVLYTSASERLSRGVAELARSLGAWCSVRKRETITFKGKGGERKAGLPAWVCVISHPASDAFFTLSRNKARVARRTRFRRPVILSIESAGAREAQCISVSHASGLYVTDDYVVTHNTALALNVAQNAATRHGRTVGVFSLEMSKEQLFLRMLCAQARVDAHRLRTGRLGKDEWARLTMAFGELTEAKIFVDDTPGISIFEMRAKSRRLKADRGLDLLIVDYLQLMRGKTRYENRTQEVSDISRSLKGLAKELKVPLIALSQLSRAPEQRGGDHKPQLSDLRESGAIEQDADVVIFIYREEVYKPTEENRGLARLMVEKQRNGPTGSVDLAFIREYTKFENLEWRST